MVEDIEGKWAVVTGAGSGIGRRLAEALAEKGADLAICDIDEEAMEATADELRHTHGAEVLTRRVDVSDSDQMETFADEVRRTCGLPSILVNNAGIGVVGPFMETSLEDWKRVLSVNLWGVVHGCYYFLPDMVEAGRGGHVVNIASVAGIWASKNLNAYSASKFAVVGLSQALRRELRPHDIGVSAICPGFVDTAISEEANYRGYSDEETDRLTAIFDVLARSPDTVADATLDAIRHDRGLVPVNPEAWAIHLGMRLAPEWTADIADWMLRW